MPVLKLPQRSVFTKGVSLPWLQNTAHQTLLARLREVKAPVGLPGCKRGASAVASTEPVPSAAEQRHPGPLHALTRFSALESRPGEQGWRRGFVFFFYLAFLFFPFFNLFYF